MRRAFIIVNPKASRTTPRGVAQITDRLAAGGIQTDHAATRQHGDATRLAAEAAADGFDLIVVYGGDGTAMQAVAGVQGVDMTIGLIPGGTSNLLASNLQIPRDPLRAAAIAADGKTRAIDLVRLQTSAGQSFFVVGAGTGYDADMMAETTPEQKKRWGVAAYVGFVARTAHRIRPSPIKITVDGHTETHEAASVLVANCPEILPPVLSLGTQVALDNGELAVIILNARGFFGAAMTVWDLLLQQETGRVRRLRGRSVSIETEAPQVVQADGDICGSTPFRAEVIPAGLRVMVPTSAPRDLFRNQ